MIRSRLSLVACAVMFGFVLVHAANSPESITRQQRIREQMRNYVRRGYVKPLDGGGSSLPGFDQSIIGETQAQGASLSSFSTAPPPLSPGLQIGKSSWDHQHDQSQGHQVAHTPGAPYVHFIWTRMSRIPLDTLEEDGRSAGYNTFPVTQPWDCWNCWLPTAPASFSIATDFRGWGHAANHGADEPGHIAGAPFQPFWVWFYDPGTTTSVVELLEGYPDTGQGSCPEVMWPQIDASRQVWTVDPGGGALDTVPIVHEIAHSNVNACETNLLWYWRFDGIAWATTPTVIDSTPDLSYVLADDPTSDHLAVVVSGMIEGLNNIFYYQSVTDGVGWLDNTEPKVKNAVSNYSDPNGPQAWYHISTCYDHSGTLHIAWDEQAIANRSEKIIIRHCNSMRNTIRPVAAGLWNAEALFGGFDLTISKLTMGIGDGSTSCQGESNNNYVYVLYTQMGGYTGDEQADHSLQGFYNGELYLSASKDGGNVWSPPANLTNTKTPNCNPGAAHPDTELEPRPDSVCRSEHWGTIGLTVHNLDIFFISDKSAGAIPRGEGTWNMNPVMYLRVPGGAADAQFICPATGPVAGFWLSPAPDTAYPAFYDSSFTLTLNLLNAGAVDVVGLIGIVDIEGAPTMSFAGPAEFTLAAGGVEQTRPLTIRTNGALPGIYEGHITITHDDPSLPNPHDIPVVIQISGTCFCGCYADPVCDGITDIRDVVEVIDRAFRGEVATVDPSCWGGPQGYDGRTDVDCSGATDVVDVTTMIAVAFRGAVAASRFCDPCAL